MSYSLVDKVVQLNGNKYNPVAKDYEIIKTRLP